MNYPPPPSPTSPINVLAVALHRDESTEDLSSERTKHAWVSQTNEKISKRLQEFLFENANIDLNGTFDLPTDPNEQQKYLHTNHKRHILSSLYSPISPTFSRVCENLKSPIDQTKPTS